MSASRPDQSHWVKDEYCLKCDACKTTFTMSVRKHHCRNCGQVYCANCTTKSIPLPKLGYGAKQAQRVCESCYSAVTLAAQIGQDEEEEMDEVTKIEQQTLDSLKRLYRAGIKPLEVQFNFGEFYSPILTDADFDSKPMVLLLGLYSVGKTSFIRYLLGRDHPGIRIGPEPTTDRFTIVCGSDDAQAGDSVIPGNALAVQADKPFRSLQRFGNAFLDHLEAAVTNTKTHQGTASILKRVTFVDTPGVLAGEKQRLGRSYDFTGVVNWFAGRCDRILLLFDAHKLDISDEFEQAIGALKGNADKIRIILNKADQVDAQQLLRVHGALMWSLSKVIKTPEVVRVYIGSFWDAPVKQVAFKDLFEKEKKDLLNDLHSLPGSAVTRKLNMIVKRARAAKTHALIIEHLRTQLPYFGKEKHLNHMLDNLEDEYQAIHRKYNVPLGDFPRPETFRRALKEKANLDLRAFPPLNQRMIVELNEILASYLPRLHAAHSNAMNKAKGKAAESKDNPFQSFASSTPMSVPPPGPGQWSIDANKFIKYQMEFEGLHPSAEGKISGDQLRPTLLSTGLDKNTLRLIWDRSDIDRDGQFDVYEFSIAKHLIEQVQSGLPIPDELPPDLIPPMKK